MLIELHISPASNHVIVKITEVGKKPTFDKMHCVNFTFFFLTCPFQGLGESGEEKKQGFGRHEELLTQ